MRRKVMFLMYILLSLSLLANSSNIYCAIEEHVKALDTYNKRTFSNQVNQLTMEEQLINFNPIPSTTFTFNQNDYSINISKDLRDILYIGKIKEEKEKEVIKAKFQEINVEQELIISVFSSFLNYFIQGEILKNYQNYYSYFEEEVDKLEKDYKKKLMSYEEYLSKKVMISQYMANFDDINNFFALSEKRATNLKIIPIEAEKLSELNLENYIQYFLNSYNNSISIDYIVQMIREINEYYYITLAPKYYTNAPSISSNLTYRNSYTFDDPNISYSLNLENTFNVGDFFSLSPNISYNVSNGFSVGISFKTISTFPPQNNIDDLRLLVEEQNNNQIMNIYNIQNNIDKWESSVEIYSMNLEQLEYLLTRYPNDLKLISDYLMIYSSLLNAKGNLAYYCFLMECEINTLEKKYNLITNKKEE